MRKKFLVFTLAFFMLICAVPMAFGITVLQDTVFLSEVGGGNITMGFDFTTDTITWSNDQVRFTDFNHTDPWGAIGFRAPAGSHMNITSVLSDRIILDTDVRVPTVDYEVYVGGKGTPSSVANVDAWVFLTDTVYFTKTTNDTVTLLWSGVQYNITIKSIYSETEAGFYTMLYANCTRAGGVNDGANVTFTSKTASFTWNPASGQYEATTMRATPQTVTFNTLSAFSSTEFTGETATIITPYATVTWTTGTIEEWQQYLVEGNWIGGALALLFSDIGIVGGYTMLMFIFSVAVYQYSGPYATFAVWLLGWGVFASQVHGLALTIAIIMLVLGFGIALAKLFLDRRTT